MKFKVHRSDSNLVGLPVLNAFVTGVEALGYTIVDDNEDVNVVWSTQWDGLEQKNRKIYENSKNNKKPVIFLDHGNLKRHENFLVGLGHTNRLGIFGNDTYLDYARPEKIGIFLKNTNPVRRNSILIVCQPERSLSWESLPSADVWVKDIVEKIRSYSCRPIVVRTHPRASTPEKSENFTTVFPQKLTHGFDDELIDYDHHCVITHDGFYGIQAAVAGVPVICNPAGLAWEISGNFEKIEEIALPERHDWLVKISHCEWSLDEISKGIPLNRLLPKLLG